MNTGIVILAAGDSSRLGEPKQLLPYRGKTLLRHVVDAATAVPEAAVAVVLGAQDDRIRRCLDGSSVLVVENASWREGMGASLRAGLVAMLAAHPEITSAVFLVCDQPFVTPASIEMLVELRQRTGSLIAASEYGGTLGVPACFARQLFPELLALTGDSGARRVIFSHQDQVQAVPFEGGAIDIDTPGDFARLNQPGP